MKHISKDAIVQSMRRFGQKCSTFWIKFPISALVCLALILTFVIECLSRRSLTEGLAYLVLHPYLFLYNTLIVLTCLSLSLLFKKRIFWSALVSVLWLALGITNCILLGMRTTPFSAIDLSLLVSCFDIIDIYLTVWEIVLITAALILAITLLVLLSIRTPKQPIPYKKRISAVVASAILLILLTAISLATGAVSTKFPNMTDAYNSYGFPYCFSLSFIDRGVSRPDDYSEDRMEDLLASIETKGTNEDTTPVTDAVDAPADGETTTAPPQADTPETEETFTPNIVFVQLESFFDVNRIAGITYSENPLPIFTHLKETCASGLLSVPSIGAGTANTEFEVLTGMNLDDFGAGEYPYKTILRRTCAESVAYNLKKLGYTAHAMHNNTGTFYDRDLIYPSLGFDTYTSLEHMQNVDYNPLGWAKDAVLTEEILTCMESTAAQDLVFAVSVQAHGKYPEEAETGNENDAYELDDFFDRLFAKDEGEQEEDSAQGGHTTGNASTVLTPEDLLAQHISVEGIEDKALATQYTYYVNQLNEVDAFIGALLAAFSGYEEPVMLVLYGDHLPALPLPTGTLSDGTTPYQTDYVIWKNYEENTPKAKNLEAFSLAAEALGTANIKEGLITALHQTMQDKEDYLASLELLEYDMLYGEQTVWGGINPYLPTDMRLGIRSITVKNVYRPSGHSHDFYVTGENFTPFSTVIVDGKRLKTEFMSQTMLYVTDAALTDGTRISVAQMTSGGEILGQTTAFLYIEP